MTNISIIKVEHVETPFYSSKLMVHLYMALIVIVCSIRNKPQKMIPVVVFKDALCSTSTCI